MLYCHSVSGPKTTIIVSLPEGVYLASIVLADHHAMTLNDFVCRALKNEALSQLEALKGPGAEIQTETNCVNLKPGAADCEQSNASEKKFEGST